MSARGRGRVAAEARSRRRRRPGRGRRRRAGRGCFARAASTSAGPRPPPRRWRRRSRRPRRTEVPSRSRRAPIPSRSHRGPRPSRRRACARPERRVRTRDRAPAPPSSAHSGIRWPSLRLPRSGDAGCSSGSPSSRTSRRGSPRRPPPSTRRPSNDAPMSSPPMRTTDTTKMAVSKTSLELSPRPPRASWVWIASMSKCRPTAVLVSSRRKPTTPATEARLGQQQPTCGGHGAGVGHFASTH